MTRAQSLPSRTVWWGDTLTENYKNEECRQMCPKCYGNKKRGPETSQGRATEEQIREASWVLARWTWEITNPGEETQITCQQSPPILYNTTGSSLNRRANSHLLCNQRVWEKAPQIGRYSLLSLKFLFLDFDMCSLKVKLVMSQDMQGAL